MKLHKKISCLLFLILAAISLTACTTSKSYTFAVDTGDNIKVKLDTSDDYSLEQENGQFTVKHADETVLDGMFLLKEGYEQYQEVKELPGVTVLEEKEKDGNSYFFYEYEGEAGTENNYVLWVKDSNTGIIIGSLAGKKEAKAAFERLTIGIDK